MCVSLCTALALHCPRPLSWFKLKAEIKLSNHIYVTETKMSRFSTHQFVELIEKRKRLDYMRFDFKDLSRVDPKALAEGLFGKNKVDKVYLKESCLTKDQLEAIFTQIAINPKQKPWDRD